MRQQPAWYLPPTTACTYDAKSWFLIETRGEIERRVADVVEVVGVGGSEDLIGRGAGVDLGDRVAIDRVDDGAPRVDVVERRLGDVEGDGVDGVGGEDLTLQPGGLRLGELAPGVEVGEVELAGAQRVEARLRIGDHLEDDPLQGRSGAAVGQFNLPRAIAIAPNGDVYVADTGNNRIQKRDASGSWSRRPPPCAYTASWSHAAGPPCGVPEVGLSS